MFVKKTTMARCGQRLSFLLAILYIIKDTEPTLNMFHVWLLSRQSVFNVHFVYFFACNWTICPDLQHARQTKKQRPVVDRCCIALTSDCLLIKA